MHPDDVGREVIERLRQTFPIVPLETYLGADSLETSGCRIGIEIEIPWRAYFPLLWQKYFGGGKKFEDFTAEEERNLQAESAAGESVLLAQLQKTVVCGIPRGRDRFWEFAFGPVENVAILVEQVAILVANGLCPLGPYSLHVTISNLHPTGRTYLGLLWLELLYSSAERIAAAIDRQRIDIRRAWARKGCAGIRQKSARELTWGDATAVELRTLELPSTLDRLLELLQQTALLANWLHREQGGQRVPAWGRWVSFLQGLLREHSLPVKNWGNPDTDLPVWEHYIAVFPSMRLAVKESDLW